VYRNGALLGSTDFTATSGTTVVLTNPASGGDLIETVSFYVSSVLNAIPAVANAVTTSYINSGAVTQAKLGTNVAGNGPAFSAYADATTQTLTTATYTKILFQTEEFDTNNNFASSRFTPTVAGYYQITSQLLFPALAGLTCLVAIYKNGVDFKEGTRTAIAATASGGVFVSALVYCNGSTDYIEIYGQQSSGTNQNLAGTNNQFLNYFQGVLVRGA
jgi:hypothetical protein